mgnify:FL=1
MLNNTKYSIAETIELDNIIIELYQASCDYVQSRIVGIGEQGRFVKTSLLVKSILLTNLSNNNSIEAFDAAHKALKRSKNQLLREQYFRPTLDKLFGIDIEKYDDFAFDIAFEILQKIKTRFIDGYVG